MNKIILLIGLLTYSSVGWTETLMMKCFEPDPESNKWYLGIYKMETKESKSSPTLLTERHLGRWDNMCSSMKPVPLTAPITDEKLKVLGIGIAGDVVCEKGDLTVIKKTSSHMNPPRGTTEVFDFRFNYYIEYSSEEMTKGNFVDLVKNITACEAIE